jgi:hypothetical protein
MRRTVKLTVWIVGGSIAVAVGFYLLLPGG